MRRGLVVAHTRPERAEARQGRTGQDCPGRRGSRAGSRRDGHRPFSAALPARTTNAGNQVRLAYCRFRIDDHPFPRSTRERRSSWGRRADCRSGRIRCEGRWPRREAIPMQRAVCREARRGTRRRRMRRQRRKQGRCRKRSRNRTESCDGRGLTKRSLSSLCFRREEEGEAFHRGRGATDGVKVSRRRGGRPGRRRGGGRRSRPRRREPSGRTVFSSASGRCGRAASSATRRPFRSRRLRRA